MAISFDEWRTAKQQGKQATDKLDFAAWRLKKQQEEEDAKKLSVTGKAGGSVGIPPLRVGGADVATEPAPLSAPMGGTLGLIQGAARGAERTVDAFGAIDPSATAQSALGASQQALGAAIRAPAEVVQQGLGPLQLLMAAAGGDVDAAEKLRDARTQRDIIEAGMQQGPLGDVAAIGAGIQESGTRNVQEAAPRMLERPENLLSPEGIAWALQQATQSAGPMAIGALASRFGAGASVAPFVPAGGAETYEQVRAQGGLPTEALGQALPRGGLEVAFESPVMQAAGAGRLARATLADIGGEVATEAGNVGLDLAGGQDVTREAARERMYGAAIVGAAQGPMQTALSSPVARGVVAAREMLAKAGGISDGRPDVKDTRSSIKIDPKINEGLDLAQPKASTSYVDAPISIAPTSIDTVDTQITTGINTEEAKREGVNPAGVSKEREIPAKEDTLSAAPLSSVQLTPADAGTIIDTRLSSLREASQRNRLDDGTVKTLQREDEELRLTLQEDGSRKQQGILQTPERPYLSDNARNLISQKRAEIREKLEQHRAAVGYGNELRDLETRLNKLGESDTEFVALADSLVRGQGAGVTRAAQQMAATTPQNQSQTLPATPVAPPVSEAPVAPQEAGTSVPASTPEVTPAPAGQAAREVQTPVTSTQVPSVSNTQKAPKAKKAPAPKTLSEGDALAQAFTELQQKSVSDPAFQKQVTDNPSLMRQLATKRAAEIVAASKAPKAPAVQVVEETPANMAAPTGWGEVEAGEIDQAPAANDNYIRSKVRNGKDALSAIVSGAIRAPAPIRAVAQRLAAVSDFSDVSITMSDNAEADGLINKDGEKAAGYYLGGDANNVKILSTLGGRTSDGSEVIVHELAHAGTIKAMERIESGELNDPELKDLMDDMKIGLKELRARLAKGDVSDPFNKAAYAAQNVYELVATVYADPRAARRLDEARVTIPRRGPRRGRVATMWQIVKDFITKYLGKYVGISPREVEQVLLSGRIREAVERMSTEKDARQAKDTNKTRRAYKDLKALAPNNIKPDTGGVELPQGTIEQRIGERIQSWTAPVVSPKGTGSTSAKLMGEKAIGISNEQRLAAEVLAVDLKKQMAKELAKGMKKLPEHARARYAFRVGQALAGDATISDELPKDIRNTVEAMRRMLDDNSLRLIAIGAVPASKIRTLLNNQGKWLHRDFDVFHHDPSEYREKVQAMARAGEDIISPLLPDIEKELQLPDADVLQTIADMLGTKGGKESWRKESMEKLRKVTGEPTPKRGATPKTNKAVRDAAEEYLRDMAAKWGIGRNTKLDGKDGIVARLIELSKNGDIRAAASRYANSLLDPKAGYNDDAPYIPSVMGIDDSSLDKRRKKVPEWMQTLWGRFQDPVAMFLTSVDNHANVIAKFTALAEYKARGMANGTVLENKEGMTDYNMFPKGFVLLQKENDPLYYGPLNGMWVKQKDMDYLGVTASQRMAEKMLSQGIGPKFFRPYSLLMQPAKMMQIAANHSSFIINAASSVFMLSRANPFTTLPRGLKAARYTALGGTRFGKAINDKTLSDDVNAMIRQGLLVNNALAGEARRKLRELIMEPGERFLPTPVKLMNKLKRAGGKVSDSLSRALSFFDEAGKVMMVYARMKDLEAIYPDKSRDEIRDIAIEHAMQTMPVASREAPIARMMGNSGVVNVYATFYAAMVRNTYNHLKLADEYSKMESPAAKRYAFAEMALLSLKAFGVYALTKSAIEMFGHMYSGNDDDDEDEREKAAKAQQEHYEELRAMHPEYQQGDVLYTRESEPDVFHFLSAQRYDPLPFGALAAASARGDENEKMNLLVSYLFSDSPILEPLSNVIGYGVQTAAGEITEPDSFSMSAKERFMKGAEGLLKAALPGAWKDFEKQYKSDDEASPFEMFAHNVGFTHGVLDLRKETGNAAAGYLAILNSLKKDAGKRVSTEDGVFFDAKADFVGDVTARAEAWRIARRKISAMQKYGKSDEWIEEAIDANPYTSSMSKDEVESLLDGVFRVPDYQEWLDKQYEMDIADPKNARRLDEVEEQYARYGKELQQFEEGLADLLKGMEVEYY